MPLTFGTDGVRDIAGTGLTPDFAMKLGQATALTLNHQNTTGKRLLILIGKDTRISCDMLENAFAAGVCSLGIDVVLLGVIATPAVAFLMSKYDAAAGVVISASHNPFEHNGIKIFAEGGKKLSDEAQMEIEELLEKDCFSEHYQTKEKLGRVLYSKTAIEDYTNYLAKISGGYFTDMRVVFDAANGASAATIEVLAKKLMLNYTIINAQPNGVNINHNCGSTNTRELVGAVIAHKATLGIAFDGDADRIIVVDEKGGVHDGDELLAIFAFYFKEKGEFRNNTLVATTMSNLGLNKFCKENQIALIQTDVGDRNVLIAMEEGDFVIGGEQSGHIIIRSIASTGDGQLAAVLLMKILYEKKIFLSRLANLFHKFPQLMINIKVSDEAKKSFLTAPEYLNKLHEIEKKLGDDGRIIVRASGTEPLIRVMVEGKELSLVNDIAIEMSEVIKNL